ncbi:MAG: acylphosphatase [Thermoprotei archaeon]
MCAAHNYSVRIMVFGTVQGVGFRAYVRRVARGLGLKGYVRNLEDGSVEILAAGPREKVEALINRVRVAEPPIRVTSISVVEDYSGEVYNDFIILH